MPLLHDYVCQKCGKPATVNYQLVWISWEITPEGDFFHREYHNVDENEFWCEDCWEREMSGYNDEDIDIYEPIEEGEDD